jgi:polar amino acid transport system permease protein
MANFYDSLAGLFDFSLLDQYGYRLWLGVLMTFKLIGISCSIGFLIAFPISRARMSSNPLLNVPAKCYIAFFRGTPLLCQLYLTYYGAGEFRVALTNMGLWWFFREAFYCCILAFSMNTGAYQAEIMRGALASVPKGQAEAAIALGLSPYRVNRHVIWPQAMLVALRPFSNELIGMIKASALSAIVTLFDLMGQTRFIFARTFDFDIYIYCALIYLAITESVRRLCVRLETALSRHKLAVRVASTKAAQQAPGATNAGVIKGEVAAQ